MVKNISLFNSFPLHLFYNTERVENSGDYGKEIPILCSQFLRQVSAQIPDTLHKMFACILKSYYRTIQDFQILFPWICLN